MVTTRSKRKATDELVSLSPPKRLAKKNSASTQQQPKRKLPSPPQRARKQPIHQSSPTSNTSSAHESPGKANTNDSDAYDADVEDEESTRDEYIVDSDAEDAGADHLLDRICSGAVYIQQQQALDEPIMQTTHFQIDTSNASSRGALTLLRRYATLVVSAPPFELFELGIPRPNWVAEGDLLGVHDPHWWVGNSLAKIKAGPHAEEADVRRAAGHLKGLETRRSKKGLTAREKENERKLSAAMESQKKKNLRVRFEDDEGGDETESEIDGGEYVPSS